MSRVAAVVRAEAAGNRSGGRCRFEKRHYRVLEGLALPGEGEGSVSWDILRRTARLVWCGLGLGLVWFGWVGLGFGLV